MPDSAAAPAPDLEREVLAVTAALVTELGATPGHLVSLDDRLDRDLGLGSLERVELLFRLEQAFAVRFDDAVLAEAGTGRDLVGAVRAVLAGSGPGPGPGLAPARPPGGPGAPAPVGAASLLDVLTWHAEATPDRVHVRCRPTYGSLRARQSAGRVETTRKWRAHGTVRGRGRGDPSRR